MVFLKKWESKSQMSLIGSTLCTNNGSGEALKQLATLTENLINNNFDNKSNLPKHPLVPDSQMWGVSDFLSKNWSFASLIIIICNILHLFTEKELELLDCFVINCFFVSYSFCGKQTAFQPLLTSSDNETKVLSRFLWEVLHSA